MAPPVRRSARRGAAGLLAVLALALSAVPAQSQGQPPTINFEKTTATLREADDNAQVTATLKVEPVSETDITLVYRVQGVAEDEGVAADHFDYRPVPGSFVTNRLTIPADASTATIGTYAVRPDDLDEGDEGFKVVLSDLTGGAVLGERSEMTVTIEDDDAPVVTLFDPGGGARANEGRTAIFTVESTKASVGDIVVGYSVTASGSIPAVLEDDFLSLGTGTVTIKRRERTAPINIPVTGNDLFEPPETFTVTLTSVESDGGRASLGDRRAVEATIVDDTNVSSIANVPWVRFDQTFQKRIVFLTEGEDETVAFRVSVFRPVAYDVTVGYTVTREGGNPAGDEDISPTSPGTVTIPAGQAYKDIEFTILDDDIFENVERYDVTLDDTADLEGVDYSIPVRNKIHTVQIRDDDEPVVTVAGPGDPVMEGGTARFTVASTTSAVNGLEVTYTVEGSGSDRATRVDPARRDDRPSSGDYVSRLADTVTIPAGEKTANIDIDLIADELYEPSETFRVRLTGVSHIYENPRNRDHPSLGSPRDAEATIEDGDGPPTVSFDRDAQTVPERGTAMATAELSHASASDVTVRYTVADGTATAGDDYTAPYDGLQGELTIPARTRTRAIGIDIAADEVHEGDESFTVTLDGADGDVTPAAPVTQTVTIEDDDVPSATVAGPDDDVTEGGKAAFTVTLDKESVDPITVDYAVGGTATAGDDYTAPSGEVTVLAGGRTAKIEIATIDDKVDEPDETLTVTLTGVDGRAPSGDPAEETASATIGDNDTPTVGFEEATASMPEEGGSVTVEVTVEPVPHEAFAVDYAVAHVSTEAEDFSGPAGGRLTIPAGASTAAIGAFAAADDELDELDETFTVTLSNPPDGTALGDEAVLTITIEDDDEPPTVTLSGPESVTEGGTATFTVTLSEASGRPVEVTLGAGGTDDTAGSADYAAPSGTLAVDARRLTKTFPVDTAHDEIDEGDETFTVTITDADGMAQGHEVTIEDDDAPVVTLSGPGAAVVEGQAATFEVESTHASVGDIVVDYGVAGSGDDQATAGDDYASAATGTATIVAGTKSRMIAIQLRDDDLAEPPETFTVTLTGVASDGSRATLGGARAAEATIADGDGAPTVSFDRVARDVPERGTARLTVELSHASASDVTVRYTVAGGTATQGTDYTAPYEGQQGELTIDAMDRTKEIEIDIAADEIDEGNESFTVTLDGADGDVTPAAPAAQTVTITDDDGPSATVAGPDGDVTEGGKAAFTVTLDKESVDPITVDYAVGGTATAGDDYTAPSGEVTVLAGNRTAKIEIDTEDDAADEPDETLTVTLTGAGGRASLGAPAEATAGATIKDNDTPTVGFAEAMASMPETDGTVAVEVSVAPVPHEAFAVDYAVAHVSTEAGDFSGPAGGTLTIPAGMSTAEIGAFAATHDDEDEPDESFTVTLVNPPDGTALDGAVLTVTIEDDDTPAVGFTEATASMKETDGSVTVSVSVDPVPHGGFTLDYAVAHVTTTAGDFSGPAGGRLTIPMGASTAAIGTFVATDDEMDEPDESFTVTLGEPPEGTALGDHPVLTVMIEDDDAPAVGFAEATASMEETDGAVAVEVTVEPVPHAAFTVDYAVAHVSTSAGDFSGPAGGRLTIPVGASTAAIGTFAATHDDLNEPDETFTVTLGNPRDGTALGDHPVLTITIGDDDAPTVGFASAVASMPETDGSVAVEVSVAPVPHAEIAIDYAVAHVSTSAGDFDGPAGGRLTIPMGASTAAIGTFTATHDDLDEPDETFTVTLGNPTGGAALGDETVLTITIGDDDAPAVGFAEATASMKETDGSVTVSVSVDPIPHEEIAVDYAVAHVTTAAGDFSGPAGGRLTIPMGASTVEIGTFAAVADGMDEPDESFTVTLDSPAGDVVLGDETVLTITIEDDDVPTLGFASATASMPEAGGAVTVEVSVAPVPHAAFAIDYAVAHVSTAVGDFGGPAGGTLTIPVGASTVEIGTFAARDDDMDEPDESFTVTLANPPDGTALGDHPVLTVTIEDDDRPAVGFAEATASMKETNGSVAVSVSVDPVPRAAFTVDYAVAHGSTSAGDFSGPAGGRLTIPVGASTAAIGTFAATDDDMDEPDETFTVTLGNPTGGARLGGHPVLTVTIEDDDAPAVGFAEATASMKETNGSVAVSVSVDPVPRAAFTVDYAVAHVSTAVGDFGGPAGGTLTIPVGASTVEIGTFAARDDDMDEPDESFTVTLANPPDGTALGDHPVLTVTIEDDDTPAVGFAEATASMKETNGSVAVSVSVDPVPHAAFAIDYEVAPGTAGTDDYGLPQGLSATGTLTIPMGASTVEIGTFAATDDDMDEPDESFTVTLANPPDGTALGDHPVLTVTIEDDDAPAVGFAGATASMKETGGSVSVSVEVAPVPHAAFAIDYAVAHVSTAVGDFGGPAGGRLTIPVGASTVEIGTFAATDDDMDEPDESFTVTLANPPDGTALGDHPVLTVTIEDDDAPTVGFAEATASMKETGGSVSVSVAVAPVPHAAFAIDYAVAHVSTAVGDFGGPAGGRLTIPVGASTVEIGTFAATHDDMDEPDESFTVTLANPPDGTALGDHPVLTVTIEDDDTPTVGFAEATASMKETDGAVTVEVSVAPVPHAAFAIDYEVAHGSTAVGDFGGPAGGTLTIPVGASTVEIGTFAATDDDMDEPDESFTVTLANPPDGTALGDHPVLTVTIEDDDAPAVGFAEATASMKETDGAVTVEVSVAPVPHAAFAIDYEVAHGSTSVGDFSGPAGGRLTIPVGASTVEIGTFAATHDDMDEPDESFTVTLANPPDGTALGDHPVLTVTIEDDDAPAVGFAGATASMKETGGSVTVEVSVAPVPHAAFTVDYAVAHGSTSAGDFSGPAGGTLTIPVGASTAEIGTFAATDDDMDEPDESFTVTLANPPDGTALGDHPVLTVTIEDDDAPAVGFAEATASMKETDGAVTVEVSVAPVPHAAFAIDYEVAHGSTSAGDFSGPAGGTLTIPVGASTVEIGTFAATDDDMDEPDESFTVTLANPPDGTALGDHPVLTVTIEDDDAPTVGFAEATASMKETDGSVAVEVSVAPVSRAAFTVDYAVAHGSTSAGDFSGPAGGRLTIPADASTVEIGTFTATHDDLDEPDETFTVTLGNPTGEARLGGEAALTITVEDDDGPPTVSFDRAVQGVPEGGTAMLTVELSHASASDVTVRYTVAGGTATPGTDYTVPYQGRQGELTIDALDRSKAIEIDISGDGIHEGDEAFTATLDSADGGVAVAAPATQTVTITDDESVPGASLSGATSVTEGEDLAITVTLDGESEVPVTLTLGARDGTATAPDDYTAPSGELTIDPRVGEVGKAFLVHTVDDSTYEGDETFTVTISAKDGPELDSRQVTIKDNDKERAFRDERLAFQDATILGQLWFVGTAVKMELPEAVGGSGIVVYRLDPPALPQGVGFDAGKRVVSGTPEATMDRTPYEYVATDAAGMSASLGFAIRVVERNRADEAAVSGFLADRLRTLASNQPGTVRFLDGGGAASGDASANVGADRVSFMGSVSADPVWGELAASRTNADVGRSRHALGAVGVHAVSSDRFLAGVMMQFDSARQDVMDGSRKVGEVEGRGWLAGPYFAGRTAARDFSVEGRLLVGRSGNTLVRADGDRRRVDFDTTRWLARLRAEGEARPVRQGVSYAPFVDASYAWDRAKAADAVPLGHSVSVGRFEAGVDFDVAAPFRVETLTLRPGASLVALDENGADGASESSASARVALGIAFVPSDGVEARLDSHYDGILDGDRESFGLSLRVDVRF